MNLLKYMFNLQKFNALTILTYGRSKCNRFFLGIIIIPSTVKITVYICSGSQICFHFHFTFDYPLEIEDVSILTFIHLTIDPFTVIRIVSSL